MVRAGHTACGGAMSMMGRIDGLAHHWRLDPGVVFLNHGSFGACPIPVLEAQAQLRERIEREPVRFFLRELPARRDRVRAVLAEFLGADPDDLAFVVNATAGVNTVLRSLDFEPGDELLTTDHAYPACRNALEFTAARSGARVVVAEIPLPVNGADGVVEALVARVTPRTRLALLDHVTSPTALVFPLERLVADLRSRGVETLVDGAHAPGMLPLDLRAIGSAYYTGNAHKWLCSPKSAAFLHVRRDRQAAIRPLSISHGAGAAGTGRSMFRQEFDWTGTHDPTPYLCIEDALAFLGGLFPGGWTELRERNRSLALRGRETLARSLGVAPPCPDSMIGSMAALPLPDGDPAAPGAHFDLDPLQETLMRDHAVEVPVFAWPAPPKRLLRISATPYLARESFETLGRALGAALPG